MDLGPIFAEARQRAGLDVHDVAAALGFKASTITRFEAGHNRYQPTELAKLAGQVELRRDDLALLDDPVAALAMCWCEPVAAHLRNVRADRDLAELATTIGVDPTTLKRWERAQTRPRNLDQLRRTLNAYGVAAAELLELAIWPPAERPSARPPLAQFLHEHRVASGMSAQRFADANGIAKGTWDAWEAGRNQPTTPRLAKLAEICEVSIDHLVELRSPRHVDPYELARRSPLTQLLTRARLAANRRIDEVACAAGVSAHAYTAWENGRQVPNVTQVPVLAAATGIDPVELVCVLEGIENLDDAPFGTWLRVQRLAAGVKLKVLAPLAGVNYRIYGEWELGRAVPGRDTDWTALADLLPASVDELAARAGNAVAAEHPDGARMRALLTQTGLSQKRLAERIGTRQGAVWSVARGRVPLPQRCRDLVTREFSVDFDSLAA